MQMLIRLVLYVVVLAAGSLALVVTVRPEIGVQLATELAATIVTPSSRVVAGVSGGLLVLLPVLNLLRWWAGRRYARDISYATESGRVSVSLIAIEEALTRAVEQDEVVRKVQIRVREDRVKRGILIDVALTLWDDGDVSTTNRRCQELIRRRFAELMPEQRAVQIHITVHRLSHRREEDTAAGRKRTKTNEVSKRRETAETADEEGSAEDAAPTPEPEPVMLPGLAATQGAVDNQAGAELLKASKVRRRATEGATELQRRQDAEPTSAAAEPVSEEQANKDTEPDMDPIPEDEEELMDDLYLGPNYVVDDEEGDTTSIPRPGG